MLWSTTWSFSMEVALQPSIFTRMIAEKVNTLHSYLLGLLPSSLSLPLETSQYNSWVNHFSPDLEWIEEAGEEAATNQELEVIIGSWAKGLVLVLSYLQTFSRSSYRVFWTLCTNIMVNRCYESGGSCHSHCCRYAISLSGMIVINRPVTG